MTSRSRLKMDPSKTPETDLSGFQEQGGYIDQETIDQLEEYDQKKKKENNLDRRTISRRKRKKYEANRERLKKSDAEIQAEGDAKFDPTPEDLKPRTQKEIDAAKEGIRKAKERIADKNRKPPERDEDGFIKSIVAADQIKNILNYGLTVRSTVQGLKSIGIPTLKFLFLNEGRF